MAFTGILIGTMGDATSTFFSGLTSLARASTFLANFPTRLGRGARIFLAGTRGEGVGVDTWGAEIVATSALLPFRAGAVMGAVVAGTVVADGCREGFTGEGTFGAAVPDAANGDRACAMNSCGDAILKGDLHIRLAF
ncbi:hypothetical protein N7494_000407 [Penicillium frequentans]|uniref:Uncharacterized protein n=1 Tax=Penicillium frequentans TaxID=3151616 RepID=A0AAD6D5W2_9EURO|nr:hypothetical protein N7494_000407 [Penicillium glabrum]